MFSQVTTDSLEFIRITYPFNILSTNLDKHLNTYSLYSKLVYSISPENLELNLYENYNSTYIRSAEKSIRDEQYLTLAGVYKINPELGLGLRASGNIFSDNRKIELNQASSSYAAVFTQLVPYNKITLSPFLGYTNNRQIGENDYGLIYGGEGEIDNLNVIDMNISSDIKYRSEDISPRKNVIKYYNLLLKNVFENNLINEINAMYSQNSKDFYYDADSITSREFNIVNNIQTRIESNYLVQDRLATSNFLEIFNLDVLGRVSWRTIDKNTRYRSLQYPTAQLFDAKINENTFELESNSGFNFDWLKGQLKLAYSERNEKHITKNIEQALNDPRIPIFFDERSLIESSKDNYSVRTALSFNGSTEISRKDKFYFNFLQSKLKYDTQSLQNYDDRDELLTMIRLSYLMQFTPFFLGFINAEATLNHIVYIFSQKSSNNNINRIIKLEAGGNYSGKNFTMLNSFEVSANYTVYDFEDINPTSRSFSFRQFTGIDSTRIILSKKLFLQFYGYVKLSEQGDFKWKEFSTRPARYLQEIYGEPKITFKYYDLFLSLGTRYFSLNNFNYKGKEKIKNSDYLSIGPVIDIFVLMNRKLYVKIYGWYEFISAANDLSREQANLSLVMNWNF
ncbi:MAG TPA: hypothetical protein VMT35_13725 [Ignavibacteriaceae bacterium]|nr:hypothetical protein [Ignavibacteriaceae bacterium]